MARPYFVRGQQLIPYQSLPAGGSTFTSVSLSDCFEGQLYIRYDQGPAGSIPRGLRISIAAYYGPDGNLAASTHHEQVYDFPQAGPNSQHAKVFCLTPGTWQVIIYNIDIAYACSVAVFLDYVAEFK